MANQPMMGFGALWKEMLPEPALNPPHETIYQLKKTPSCGSEQICMEYTSLGCQKISSDTNWRIEWDSLPLGEFPVPGKP